MGPRCRGVSGRTLQRQRGSWSDPNRVTPPAVAGVEGEGDNEPGHTGGQQPARKQRPQACSHRSVDPVNNMGGLGSGIVLAAPRRAQWADILNLATRNPGQRNQPCPLYF